MDQTRPEQSTTQSGKRRASRIPLTYYRKGDGLSRWKFWLAVGLAFLGSGYAACAYFVDQRKLSPGPVASVHSKWDAQCSACHRTLEPLAAETWSLPFFRGPERFGEVTCKQCHPADAHVGAPANEKDKNSKIAHDEAACAACHREHSGASFSLTSVADANCLACHKDLKAHATTAAAAKFSTDSNLAYDKIRSFGDGHPKAFRSLAGGDPGRLKFSHRRHLIPGQVIQPGDKEHVKMLDDLPAEFKKHYKADDKGRVVLECASCHQSGPALGEHGDSAGSSLELLQTPTGGDYMQPIQFDRHCAACHEQVYSPIREPNAVLEAMPHGLQPAEMERIVEGAIVRRYQQPRHEPRPDVVEIPGKSQPDEVDAINYWTELNRSHAANSLRDKCVQCHDLKDATATPLKSSIVGPQVPVVWLEHSRFDHQSHRSFKCESCHRDVPLGDPKKSKSNLDNHLVLIPGYETCRACHTSELVGGPAAGTAGARADCVECHRYHGADKLPGLAGGGFTARVNEEHDLTWYVNQVAKQNSPSPKPDSR